MRKQIGRWLIIKESFPKRESVERISFSPGGFQKSEPYLKIQNIGGKNAGR